MELGKGVLMRAIPLAVVCVAVTVAGQVQAAPITYTYSPNGAAFDTVFGSDFTVGVDRIISATATFNTQPTSTTTSADAGTATFSTTAFGNAVVDFPLGVFGINSFTFDASGNITAWTLFFGDPAPGVGSGALDGIAISSSPFFAVSTAGFEQAFVNGDGGRLALQSLGPGSWSASSSPAVPEPTSLALLATGAFGFMGYGWRRKRKQLAA